MHNFAHPFKLALYYYGITFLLHYITGWNSVGSVPSPLDDPHSEATQPGAILNCTCSTRVFRPYLVVVAVLQFFCSNPTRWRLHPRPVKVRLTRWVIRLVVLRGSSGTPQCGTNVEQPNKYLEQTHLLRVFHNCPPVSITNKYLGQTQLLREFHNCSPVSIVSETSTSGYVRAQSCLYQLGKIELFMFSKIYE